MMDKKLIQKIILAALVVIFVILLFKFFSGQGKNPAPAKSALVAVVPPQPGQKAKPAAVEDANWGRCPFSGRVYAPPVASSSKNIDLKLTGILWEENKASALINNSIFKEGDVIGSYTLFKIKKNSVILSDGDKEIELKLGQK